MKEIPKMLGGLLIVALLLAHLFLFGLFIAPADRLLGLLVKNNIGFLIDGELPQTVETFFIANRVTVDGDYHLDSSTKSRIMLGILRFRKNHFMTDTQKLTLDMNLLNYGEGIIGLKAASEYYYKMPLAKVTDKEWITLVNFQKIFSKK